jgi:hypothetical protein
MPSSRALKKVLHIIFVFCKITNVYKKKTKDLGVSKNWSNFVVPRALTAFFTALSN